MGTIKFRQISRFEPQHERVATEGKKVVSVMVGPGITISSQVLPVLRISTDHMPHTGFYALDSKDDREEEG